MMRAGRLGSRQAPGSRPSERDGIAAGWERYLEFEVRRRVPGTVGARPLLPLLWIAHQDPRAAVVAFPSAPVIGERGLFVDRIRTTLAAVRERPERLVVLPE